MRVDAEMGLEIGRWTNRAAVRRRWNQTTPVAAPTGPFVSHDDDDTVDRSRCGEEVARRG
jgi:hypothetical protein